MRSLIRFFHIRSLFRSYDVFQLASAHQVPSLLLQQAKLHCESGTCFGQILRIDPGRGPDTIDEDKEDRNAEPLQSLSMNKLLLERIRTARNLSVLPALRRWIEDGNKLGVYQAKVIFTRLEWEKKFAQALEVSEWLLKERPFELVEHHHARWLYYVGKVRGYEKAEETFSLIPPEFQKEVSYCKLHDIYLEYHKEHEAEGIIKRMKDQQLPVPAYLCNNLITFYDKNLLRNRIPELLKMMEEENISYSIHTYNILLACTSRSFALQSMEKIWGHLESDSSLKPDFVSYITLASAYFFAHKPKKAFVALQGAENNLEECLTTVKRLTKLMSLYGLLQKGEDIERVYQKLKCMRGKLSIPSYICAVEAFGEAGFLDSVAQVMKEMEQERGLHNISQYNALLGVYCKKAMMKRAEEVLEKILRKHSPDIMTNSYFLLGYLRTGNQDKAMRMFGKVLTTIRDGEFNVETFLSTEWLLTMHRVIRLLSKNGDVNAKHVKSLLYALEASKFHKYPRSYYFIKKAYEKSYKCSWHDRAN